jgi:hypothetical protein
MFNLIDALLLRPLPVQRPRELVQLMHLGGIVYPEFSPEFCRLMQEHPPDAFSEVACEGELDVAFAEGANIERVHVDFVSPNYFSMLGVGTPVTGYPITYSVGGKQFVAISVGNSLVSSGLNRLTPDLHPSNVFVFALP